MKATLIMHKKSGKTLNLRYLNKDVCIQLKMKHTQSQYFVLLSHRCCSCRSQ